MRGYDFSSPGAFSRKLPALTDSSKLLVICDTDEVAGLMDVFGWDADTVEECTNIDETVRFTSYDGYDFISLIYVEKDNGAIIQQELNLFVSRDYFVLVTPRKVGAMLSKLTEGLLKAVSLAETRSEPLMFLYYHVFDSPATDFSEILEALEDEAEALYEAIEQSPSKSQSAEIGTMRRTAYFYKKLLRSFSYIGGQVLIDANQLLDNDKSRYFRNIDTRLIKLFDFADNLYDLTNGLLTAYDSKFSAQMNETVNKLTIITLFFGPMTVIAGIYGMNFVHMPELNWELGYPLALGLMALVSFAIYIFLRKRRWL